MGFSIFVIFSNLLIPVIMMITGRLMWKRPPASINWALGYRTSMSMKNMDTWKFAHEHCGKLWWKLGCWMLIISVVVQLPFLHSSEDVIGNVGTAMCLGQCVILILSVIPTERALKRTFTKDGIRKDG